MRSTVKLLSLALLVVLVSVPALAQNGKCEPLKGSLAAQLVPAQGWVGQGYLAFGKDEPIATSLLDQPVGAPGLPNNSGGLSGKERLTFTTRDLSTVVMAMNYWGNARPVPFMNEYVGSGDISGTGNYQGVTGTVHIQGQYIIDMGNPPDKSRAWPLVWMAEIQGVICGRK